METAPTTNPEGTDATGGMRGRRARMIGWSILATVLIGYIAFGSVSAISYTYYAFSGRLVRLSPKRSLIDIWSDATSILPEFSVGWLPGAVIGASAVIAVMCAIAGMWLILVQAPDARPRSTRSE